MSDFSSSGNDIIVPGANSTTAGFLTAEAQTIGGTKTFTSTISGSITGNAGTATALQTARTINGASFDGSTNITITAANPNVLTLGSYLTGTSYDGSSAVTAAVDATATSTAGKIVARDASGNFAANVITASLAGNASTASTLQTARTINGASFDGSTNITITASNPNALTIGTGLLS